MKLDYSAASGRSHDQAKRNAENRCHGFSDQRNDEIPGQAGQLKLAEFEAMDADQQERIVQATIVLNRALRSRCLISFGGAFLKARKELKQDDV